VSTRNRMEQRLPSRLEELAAPRTPSYFDDVISTTARTRQRPGWSFPERWLPVSVLTDRLATAPRAPMRALAVAALLLLALAALILVAGGSRQPSVPAPFGVAANGQIAWVDSTGSIVTAGLDGAEPSVVVAGPGNDRPQFSPDGTRLAYLRQTSSGADVVVAAADGSEPVTLASVPRTIGLVWAPDSQSLVLANAGELTRIEARAGATRVVIATGVADTYDWNVEPAMIFRPPAGDEIAYIKGNAGDKRIVVAKADGSAPHEILAPGGAVVYKDIWGLRWSPDGTQLLVMATRTIDPDSRVFVLNADGSGARQVNNEEIPGVISSEGNAQWSPDGTSLLLQLWLNEPDNPGVQPLIVMDVADGTQREAGNPSNDGFTSFAWSPDGRSIYSVDDAGALEIIDAQLGTVRSTVGTSSSGAAWQRVHP
jgi:Tol biopolymer transport system component